MMSLSLENLRLALAWLISQNPDGLTPKVNAVLGPSAEIMKEKSE